MCYPQPGIATGYSFACENKWQPSLEIMVRELEKEYEEDDLAQAFDGTLSNWINQGVLLLNASLSCEQWKPNTHRDIWRPFMINLIIKINDFKITRPEMNSLVFVMLGKEAQYFNIVVEKAWHFKINRYHPAVETRGELKFEGFFQEANKCLIESGQNPINWITND